MSGKTSGLYLLSLTLNTLTKWINAENEINQKEHIKVATIRAKQTATTLQAVGILTITQLDFMKRYIDKMVDKTTTAEDRLKAYEIVEDGIRED